MNTFGKNCLLANLGQVGYGPAVELQRRLVEARKAGEIPDVLLFCEHPHVITLGRNGTIENLRAGNDSLAGRSIEFHSTNRGGDITYHGPGQIVGYPILDLSEHRRDLRWYVEQLEELMIRAGLDFGVAGSRSEGQHGVWVRTPAGEEKIAALGVHVSRWVTSHGFAYNVSTDLGYFDLIVPCGIAGKRVTSLERALGRTVAMNEVRARLAARFGEVFEREMENITPENLAEFLTPRGVNFDRLAAAL